MVTLSPPLERKDILGLSIDDFCLALEIVSFVAKMNRMESKPTSVHGRIESLRAEGFDVMPGEKNE